MINYMFSNGLDISYSSNRIYDQTIKGTATNNKLRFGTIASTYVEIVLDNTDGYFDTYSFKNVSINLYDEDKKKIKVYIDSVNEKNRLITIKAYDAIIKLDRTWQPCKTPIALYDFVKDIAKQCNIELNVLVMPNGGYNIHNIEDLKGKTCRQCLSYALELAGYYGYIDSEDKLAFKWFSFNNKKYDITIEHLVDYNTDHENSIVDNIYFVRGSKVYYTSKNPKGSIFISKDNPLLKEASSDKVQEIIDKLAHRSQLEYLPCTINATDYFQYTIGDIVTFNDNKGKTRNAIIGSVTYSGHNTCVITSVNVDEQDITPDEADNNNSVNSTFTGTLYFYRKTGSTDIEFKECSDNTEIEYFLNFNVEDAFDSLSVYINNDFYKSFDVHNGNNTICLMLKGDIIKDTVNLIDVMTDNTLKDIEVNALYRNCLIIDYSEQNSEVEVGEDENASGNTIDGDPYVEDEEIISKLVENGLLSTYLCDSGAYFYSNINYNDFNPVENSNSTWIEGPKFGISSNDSKWAITRLKTAIIETNMNAFGNGSKSYKSSFVYGNNENWINFLNFIEGSVSYNISCDSTVYYEILDKNSNVIQKMAECKNGVITVKNNQKIQFYVERSNTVIKDINITIKSYPANGNNHIYLGTEMVKDADGYNVSYYKNQELDNIKDVSISVDNVFITNLQNYDEFINIKNSNIETAGKIDSLLEIYTNLK